MEEKALGLIETKGFVGVVEAADAAAKAANVEVVSYKLTTGGLVMISIIGDVGSVQAAVSAGGEAVKEVGELVSMHVIPRPYGDLINVLGLRDISRERAEAGVEDPSKVGDVPSNDLDSMTVVQLRRLARGIQGLSIKGRQISSANKEKLTGEIRKAREKR